MQNLELLKVLAEEGSVSNLSFGQAWDVLVNNEPETYAMRSEDWNNVSSVVFTTKMTTRTGESQIVPVIRNPNGSISIWHPSSFDLFNKNFVLFSKED